jgi:uncharacterized protein YdhG (YjbR/CyaY superfamily)
MAKTDFKSVDEYVAAHPQATQAALQQVRRAIQQAVPEAQELVSYQIAAYKLAGAPLLYFAGWKKHYSLYPVNEHLASHFQDDLSQYEIEKSTIRFPLDQPVPVKLIGRIAKYRALELSKKTSAGTSRGLPKIRNNAGEVL